MVMSAVAEDTASLVSAQVERRWLAIDPLLPEPGRLPPGCGAELVVAGADGQLAAIGSCDHREGIPGSLDLAWGAARRFVLTVRIAGPDVAAALDQLLSLWRDHLAAVPGAGNEDTAAIVDWPSRDIHGVVALQRHGFAPLEVIAARKTGRHPAPARPGTPQETRPHGVAAGKGLAAGTSRDSVLIRRAGPADIDAVTRLGMEVVRFDSRLIGVPERPDTTAVLRREVASWLGARPGSEPGEPTGTEPGKPAGPQSWTWLAERDGTAVGMLYAQRPESSSWIAPMVRLTPATYLMLMFVQSSERGSGVGAAMVSRLHREIADTGVAVTLLHYAQVNPLSVPFWSQQGYRPLWTIWEAKPAAAIR
jgi:GNAT superfamily N-acetyltransferase